MSQDDKPKRPVLTLKGRPGARPGPARKPANPAAGGALVASPAPRGQMPLRVPKALQKPQKAPGGPPAQKPKVGQRCKVCGEVVRPPRPPKVPGPAYTAPRQPTAKKLLFWMVQRSTGRRPNKRYDSLQAALGRAQLEHDCNPTADVWVYECRTVETIPADPGEMRSPS